MFMYLYVKKFSYLLWSDLELMMSKILDNIKSIKEKEPGYHMNKFEEKFEQYWTEKNTGVKKKRNPIVFDTSETESEGNSSDISIEVKK